MTRHTTVTVLLILGFVLIDCGSKSEQPKPPQDLQELARAHGSATPNSVAGVAWSLPQRWVVSPPRQMRVATYVVPALQSDAQPAECGVFYFGNDQGGSVDANIDRWVKQFETANAPVRASRVVGGLNVELVQVAGTYLAPGGPMMQSQGKKENFRLLGAIVKAPEGSVFFKLIGPANTIASVEGDFNTLISSLKKD